MAPTPAPPLSPTRILTISLTLTLALSFNFAPDAGAFTTVCYPGGGIYYYWQAGVGIYLEEKFNLEQIKFAGASAGALTSTIQACNVDFITATEKAVQISEQERVWERPVGLFGIWGALVREWLNDLLPEDAAQRCDGRVSIAVTSLPKLQTELIDEYTSRDEVIDTCLASIHIPFFMDGKLATVLKGRPVLDGSFWYFATKNRAAVAVPTALNNILYFDYGDDARFMKVISGNFVELVSVQGIWDMMKYGYEFAERSDKLGRLEALNPHRKLVTIGINKLRLDACCRTAATA